MKAAELWRRGQIGWPRRFPVVQFPNAPLLGAFAGWALAAASDGGAHTAGRVLFLAGIAVWAWQEAADGVNWLRRALGVVGLVWVAVQILGEL